MNNDIALKQLVQEKYTAIAGQSTEDNQASCCGAGGCSTEIANIMTDDYSEVEGYVPAADLGLGCGLPTRFAHIKQGDTVLDLGSGAGNDCFIARREAGEAGKVIGIDFTPAMIEKARANAVRLGYENLEFILGDIEQLPLADNSVDVVVSNCVLNLVPNKKAVFEQIFRVLKPGGHFSISDVVLQGDLPAALRNAAEMYAGCVAGAIERKAYMDIVAATGFSGITLQKEKPIHIPADILGTYFTPEEILAFNSAGQGIFSITVYAEKPAGCCAPGCCN